MTLANTPIINTYVGTGAANSYPFSFPVFSSSDVTVTATSPTNVIYILTLGIDFTVSGLNPVGAPASSGSITLISNGQLWISGGNLATNWTLTITRLVSVAQNTSIRNQGDFYPETFESALDYLTMICQQLQLTINNQFLPSTTTGPGDYTLTKPGAGLVCVTPDGTKTYRIFISNSGAISAQRLT